ncbi:hypothetical protein [Fibrobacter sp. UWB12]|uniref:hypothetical protein n=1 Tax=Fibrobacter sp. UWB12 TaxID=1896203 RepID=UPI00091F0CF4|nr:hypothetical protein [Fibrobacter sp. UWB12]SHK80130.1 hypothetical protein SAMN05720759_106282 [Fibrobacter sp. UWB12]
MTLNKILPVFAFGILFWACSDNDVAGGASGDAGVYAIKDLDVAGVSQKGPFVTGSAVTVQELDGITLKQTGKSFKGTIKSDKGDFAIKDINLQSQYAILEANGYYRDEISGKKSSGTVTLRALTDLSNRKTVNINLLTHLEYERVMYLVTEKKKSIAEAKEQAEKEILATFGIEGDFAESEDLNIFESGDGNAALLAVSVLMQSDVDVAGLTERMGEFSISLAEGGSWDDADTKTAIADWASDVDLKGTIANVRKNVENWKYADSAPAFEKFVTNFWWNNYGLGVCNDKRENETRRNVNKLSKLYDEYFVCEKGRWHVPGDEPESSSSSGKDESSSSIASSSSVYNPFNSSASQDSLSVLPPELQFFEEFCSARGPVIYGDGEQRVWTCTSWANVHDTATRDSAASALVDALGAKGFVFEKTMLSDSLKSFYLHSFYDSLSYIYSAKKGDLVYKIAMTKTLSPAGAGYGAFMFDVAIFVMKEGFEDLPIHISSSSVASSSSIYSPFVSSSSSSVEVKKDTLPDLPEELAFVEDFLEKKTEYKEYADGAQIMWRGQSPALGSGCDSIATELINKAGGKGFEYEGTYSNDSLDNDYTEDSYVYTKTSGGKVYTLVITKGEVRVWTPMGITMPSKMFYVKLVVRDEGVDEIPTETKKDYDSPKYREIPEDLKFVLDSTQYHYRYYSNDQKWTSWNAYTRLGSSVGASNDDYFDEAKAKADEYALMMETHGFTLKSQETLTIDDLESMRYTEYTKSDYDGELTFYRFEKEVEKFRYEAEVFAVVDYYRDLGAEGYLFRARINITIYDK